MATRRYKMDWKRLFTGGLAFLKKLKPTTLVIIVLVGIVFFQRACYRPEVVTEYKDRIVMRDTVITKYDTIHITDEKIKLVRDITYVNVPYVIPADVDTAAILSAYYATNLFNDTLSNNKVLFAVSRYKVSQNELERQSFVFKIMQPQKIEYKTTIINPKVNTLYIDGELGGNLGMFNASAGLSLVDKKNHKYSVRYDFISKTYNFGMGFKLIEYGKSK